MELETSGPGPRIALAAAGPILLGGVLSARLGEIAPLVALPLIVAGLTALTIPALYIGSAAIGAAPAPDAIAASVGRALASLGAALCGLAVPLAFLVATSATGVGVGLGSVALVVASLFGLGALYRGLFSGQPPSFLRDGLFGVWALVALGIGARLYADLALGAVS
jgi:hypothetical protein